LTTRAINWRTTFEPSTTSMRGVAPATPEPM